MTEKQCPLSLLQMFQLLNIVGIMISSYAYYVRYKVLKSSSYIPICDISEKISCSKAFGSKFSKTLGIPNPLLGITYYFSIFMLSLFKFFLQYIFYLTILPFLFSIYLAYISYFRQRNFCIVCTFTYLLNFVLTYLSFIITQNIL